MREIFVPHTLSIARDCIAATEDADAIFYGLIGFMIAPSLMEKFQIPAMGIYLQPHYPTGAFSPALMPPLANWIPFRQGINKFIYKAVDVMSDKVFRPMIDKVRQELLNLPPLNTNPSQLARRAFPITHGFSPLVVQAPQDWREALHISGYWFLDEDYEPSNKFSEWLSAGESPVYIGFGSMTQRDKEATTTMILEAVEMAGVRCVLLSGWAEIGQRELPDNFFMVDNVPHSWLFPKMAAVVHHGGAGTSAAGLRAGVPSILVPHLGDQPFWADRVYRLGVSPKPIPRNKLSAKRLAEAITEATTDESMKRRAAELGEKIRAEDGIANAIRFFEDYVLKQDFRELL